MSSIIALVLLTTSVLEIMYAPRLDLTSNNSLLLWYNAVDDKGNKVRKFKQLI